MEHLLRFIHVIGLVILVALSFTIRLYYSEEPELKNYYCSKCGSYIESMNDPRRRNYPEGGAPQWKCHGLIAEKLYQCNKYKYGLVIKSKDCPYHTAEYFVRKIGTTTGREYRNVKIL